MATFITASICLSDIPKDHIKIGNNGKKYLSVVIAENREPDMYGNTHFIAVSQTKEERDAKQKRVYLGNGKAYQPQSPAAVTPEAVESMRPMTEVEADDLPF